MSNVPEPGAQLELSIDRHLEAIPANRLLKHDIVDLLDAFLVIGQTVRKDELIDFQITV